MDQSTHLPLKINTSGVIPPIFASSIIMFPATVANFINVPWIQTIAGAFRPGQWGYELLYVAFIFFFCFFYTAVTFNPVDVAENMKKQGGYIPGIRPGKRTADYIDRVLTRITLGGRVLRLDGLRIAVDFNQPIQCPLLLRRHGFADRGGGGHRHDCPDGIPHAQPALRRLFEKGGRHAVKGRY